jgi:hypothetical protein
MLGESNKGEIPCVFSSPRHSTDHLHRCAGSCRTGACSGSNLGPVRSTFSAEGQWTRTGWSPVLRTGLYDREDIERLSMTYDECERLSEQRGAGLGMSPNDDTGRTAHDRFMSDCLGGSLPRPRVTNLRTRRRPRVRGATLPRSPRLRVGARCGPSARRLSLSHVDEVAGANREYKCPRQL